MSLPAKFILATAFGLIAATTQAAEDGMYGSLNLGYSQLATAVNTSELIDIDSKFTGGGLVGVTYGFILPNAIRIEGEAVGHYHGVSSLTARRVGNLSLKTGELDADGIVASTSYLANVFYDLDFGARLTPYLGGGVGFANFSVDDVEAVGAEFVDDKDQMFAYQLGAGLSYRIDERFSLGVGYRFFQTSDSTLEDASRNLFESEYAIHDVRLELRIHTNLWGD